jgi:hypothetical protein
MTTRATDARQTIQTRQRQQRDFPKTTPEAPGITKSTVKKSGKRIDNRE